MRRQWPSLLGLWAVLVAALIGLRTWNGNLHANDAGQRAEGGRIVALVNRETSRLFDIDPAPAGGPLTAPVAAITVERTDGNRGRESFFYARVSGIWRCTSHMGLVADDQQLFALMQSIIDAQGTTRSFDGDNLTVDDQALVAYQLDDLGAVRVSLHGVDVLKEGAERDVLFSVDIGRPLARGGCFVRRSGEATILQLDRDIGAGLRFGGRPVVGLPTPPLVDRYAIPSAWPGFRSGLDRIFLDRADGTGFELRREALDVPPTPDGRIPAKWVLIDAETGEAQDAQGIQGSGYEFFLSRAPFARPIDPRTLTQAQVQRPEATLTLVPMEGDMMEVLILPPNASGARIVIDHFSQTVVEVDRTVGDLLLPSIAQLTDPAMGNPWDPYLR